MVKINSYTPAWLNEPAPGHGLFAPPELDPNRTSYGSKQKPRSGPRRTVARRGTEVFVANGRELRWGDLVYLKEQYATKQTSATPSGVRIKREDSDDANSFAIYEDETVGADLGSPDAKGVRTIKTPVADDIKQIIMSPQSNYLAVLTAHTVHICLLPDPSHLTSTDSGPLKAKFWTLGPTTHVTSRPAISSAVWHPLGVGGSSLVTVTEDAVVRVWELSTADRWSFDSPTLAIDLKKLADGTTLDQDFSASVGPGNNGFSPDSFDMEVAAACFGGQDSGGWSPMTLWIAMRGGDVYALCPLLPQRWAPTPTLIPQLSVSVVAKVKAMQDDVSVSALDRLLAHQQLDWMADLDHQEPRVIEATVTEPAVEVYSRPPRPGAVPRLQGPFELDLEAPGGDDLDVELTDIFVIGEKVDTKDVLMGEDDESDYGDEEPEGLSVSVICLVSTSGQLRICLDLDGVEAQWLPAARTKMARLSATAQLPSLLTFQTLDVMRPLEVTEDAWPMFSEDVKSRYSFFVTHPSGIMSVSLTPWVFRLESELHNDVAASGSDFRMDLLVGGSLSTRDCVYTHKGGPLAACVAIRDPDLGYFLLSCTPQRAVALVLDACDDEMGPVIRPLSPVITSAEEAQPLVIYEPRPAFQPPDVFGDQNEASDFVRAARSSRYHALMGQEIRLSPVALTIFTNAHQKIDGQTERINTGVAELFTRLKQLPVEFYDQVIKTGMLKDKIDQVSGVEDLPPIGDDERLRSRLESVRSNQRELAERVDQLKRQAARACVRELSDKEKAWVEELRALESSILDLDQDKPVSPHPKIHQYQKRFEEVSRLKEELVRHAEALGHNMANHGEKIIEDGPVQSLDKSPATPTVQVPADVRKAKITQVMQLLERESALVEAVMARVEKLSV